MLHRINLLPWREELQARHKRRFVSILALGAVLAVGAQWIAASYLQHQTDTQQARARYLDSYIGQLDKRINELKQVEQEHQALLTRLSVVENLQTERNKTTDFMNVLPTLVPEGVYVDKIKMNGLHIQMSGISDTTSRLATMLDNLESSADIRQVEMHSIVHDKPRFGKKFQTFNVSFSFVSTRPEVSKQGGKHHG